MLNQLKISGETCELSFPRTCTVPKLSVNVHGGTLT
jgi:hypothetical protein